MVEKDTEESGRERRRQDDDEVSTGSSKRRKPAVTAVDIGLEFLDCTICYAALKPPVFQCAFGHVVCSCCHAKLPGDKCHICSAGPATACYNRCHALEHVLESVKVPCAHAAHGCAAKTAYHDREAHQAACPHAPCFCPEPGGCGGFAGGAPSLLLSHLVSVHGWPCSVFQFDKHLVVPVVEERGARVLRSSDYDGGDRRLFFLLVTRPAPELPGVAVSAVCVEPHAAAAQPRFAVRLQYRSKATDGPNLNSFTRVKSTDLADGMPSDSDCFPLVLPHPNSWLGSRGGVLTVTVTRLDAPAV